MSLDDVWK